VRYRVEPPPKYECRCRTKPRYYKPDPACSICSGTGFTINPALQRSRKRGLKKSAGEMAQ
jgi:hypothetical protein